VFPPNELIRAVWAHPPSPPPAPVRVGLWYIITSLLRDGGVLNSREAPRSWRWTAWVLALLYQSLWCVALIWLMYTRFLLIPWAGPDAGEGSNEHAIEVTWIDDARARTTPALPTPLPEPVTTRPEPLPEPLPAPESEPELAPERPLPALMLTEVETPDEDAFTLPAPRLQQRRTAPVIPELPASVQREIPLTQVPLLQRPDRDLPVALPPPPADLATPELGLPEREIPLPLPELALRPLPAAAAPPLELPVHSRVISEREIPAPLPEIELRPLPPSELPSPPLPSRTRPLSEREIALSPPVATPSLSEEIREIDLTPPSQTAHDVWEQPATSTGSVLVDEHGRPRLAAGSGRAGGGLPPGTIVEDYANIDRMGTWLKRPVSGYQPGPLDQIWVPHENILEQWVRRSIKNIWIPIPGSDKVIRCTVVLLMLGGGCGITDPNLLDIEASSRPPPEIPFKPELHEDQDSLRPASTHPPSSQGQD